MGTDKLPLHHTLLSLPAPRLLWKCLPGVKGAWELPKTRPSLWLAQTQPGQQAAPGQAAAAHRSSCSHSKKASPEPPVKFNLQPEGQHMRPLPSAFRMFLLLQLQVQSPFYSFCVLAAVLLLQNLTPLFPLCSLSLSNSSHPAEKARRLLQHWNLQEALYARVKYKKPLRSNYKLQQRHHTFESNCSLNKLLVQEI